MRIPNPLLIAECGNNHEGSLDAALELLERAHEAGADLIKFQAGNANGFARHPEDIQRYRRYELGRAGYDALIKRGHELGVHVFFSVWSEEFADYRTSRRFHKIAARQYCKSQLDVAEHSPVTVFVSIPHCLSLEQIKEIGFGGCWPLHCVTEYPARDPQLIRIKVLKTLLGRSVGYSDHTVGIRAAVEAVHLYGATVIEKHFTLKHDFGPLRDHQLSATPEQFRELVMSVRG